jgi:hypothetical protein
MIQKLVIRPDGVPLHKFLAEVDVVAEQQKTKNLLIITWNKIYKELSFSSKENCWIVEKEYQEYPKKKGFRLCG